jgi:hypothetical protein
MNTIDFSALVSRHRNYFRTGKCGESLVAAAKRPSRCPASFDLSQKDDKPLRNRGAESSTH